MTPEAARNELRATLQEISTQLVKDGQTTIQSQLLGLKNELDRTVTQDDLGLVANFVGGYRLYGKGGTDGEGDYDEYLMPASASCNPMDFDYTTGAVLAFITTMGCPIVSLAFMDFMPVGDTNPETGEEWEEDDAIYMGLMERADAVHQGWIKERLSAVCMAKDGTVFRTDVEFSYDESTQEYVWGDADTRESNWVAWVRSHGDTLDPLLEESPILRAAAVSFGLDSDLDISSVARDHIREAHKDLPVNNETTQAMVDVAALEMLEKYFGDNVEMVLNAPEGTPRAQLISDHLKDPMIGRQMLNSDGIVSYKEGATSDA